MKGFVKGFTAFFSAFGFIFSNGLTLWYLVPVLLYVLLVAVLAFSLIAWLNPIVTDFINTWLGFEISMEEAGFWNKTKSLLTSGLTIAISIAMKILIGYMLGRIMKYVILIITSPLLAFLSEISEEKMTGKSYSFSFIQLMKDSIRGILITLRNLFLELVLMALGFVFSFFMPFLSPLIVLVLFVINCYFMGFSMFDYILERRKMGIKSSVKYMRSNSNMVFGLGLAYNLVSMVPLADWVIAPVNGSVGAVLAMETEDLESSDVLTEH